MIIMNNCRIECTRTTLPTCFSVFFYYIHCDHQSSIYILISPFIILYILIKIWAFSCVFKQTSFFIGYTHSSTLGFRNGYPSSHSSLGCIARLDSDNACRGPGLLRVRGLARRRWQQQLPRNNRTRGRSAIRNWLSWAPRHRPLLQRLQHPRSHQLSLASLLCYVSSGSDHVRELTK